MTEFSGELLSGKVSDPLTPGLPGFTSSFSQPPQFRLASVERVNNPDSQAVHGTHCGDS